MKSNKRQLFFDADTDDRDSASRNVSALSNMHFKNPMLSSDHELLAQIDSLKQIISTLEGNIFKRLKDQAPSEDFSSHEQLCEVWREKVFQSLVQKKKSELIQQDNLKQYNSSYQKLLHANRELSM